MPQGSVLRQILFSIFLNDIVAVLKKSQLYNFADDNTIYAEANSTDDLLKILKEELILNPDKFQAIVLQKYCNNTNITLNIENITINISKSVKLLGITIDNKLNFEEHINLGYN